MAFEFISHHYFHCEIGETILQNKYIFDSLSKVCTLLLIFGLTVVRTTGTSKYWDVAKEI